jgi:ABC-type multidrug transport system ATPase subunit
MTLPTTTTRPVTRGVHLTAVGLTTVHADGGTALDGVDLSVEPGRLTAVIGPSGAGKTTLLAALAGLAPAQSGSVTLHRSEQPDGQVRIGYVPQDDILHDELPLRRTLRYAAAVRLDASADEIDAAVARAMAMLGLSEHGAVRVADLSGGQRKRASIACELLSRPDVSFLDEPTSGLDPAAATDLLRSLRRMTDAGGTVVFTTHSVQDVMLSDRVVVLAPGGRLVAAGPPDDVLAEVGVHSFAELYEVVAARPRRRGVAPLPQVGARRRPRAHRRTGALRQWQVLTRRSAETVVRNRLTLSILLGSPAAVIAMFAVLFRPDTFDGSAADAAAAPMVAYWLAFAGFFFGVTFGLLQVCTEVPMLRREHQAGVRIGAYVLSKLALLTPFLLLVNAGMLVVLRVLDRIPALPADVVGPLFVTMGLNAVAALALGLLASAAVRSTAQAALALPMLCFPAVLFAGAMVPVPAMTTVGRAIAAVMPDRWAFEAIARHLDVAAFVGPASPHVHLGASSTATYWLVLVAFTVVLVAAAYAAVRRRAVEVGR